MRLVAFFLLTTFLSLHARAAGPPQESAGPQPSGPPSPPASERVQEGSPVPAPSLPGENERGYMSPEQVKNLLHKIWLAQYRVNDLLTQVHPEHWNLPAPALNSFNQMLETLRRELSVLEEWRGQFEKRTDSMYLGFETYATLNAVLPRLDGAAKGIAQHENLSLAAQYSQAENQLFDLQQTLEPYLGFLLQSQDQMLFAVQRSLAGCQKQLGEAMRATPKPVKVIANPPAVRPETRRRHLRTASRGRSATGEQSRKKAHAAASPTKPE